MNFVFVAYAFGLHVNILKPFPEKNFTEERQLFNYRFSRERRTVENAFGILANRFKVYHMAIHMKPDKINQIVLASVTL